MKNVFAWLPLVALLTACDQSIECADSTNTSEIVDSLKQDLSSWKHTVNVSEVMTESIDEKSGKSSCRATISGTVLDQEYSGIMQYQVQRMENSDKAVRVTINKVDYRFRNSFESAVRHARELDTAIAAGFKTVKAHNNWKHASAVHSEQLRILGRIDELMTEVKEKKDKIDMRMSELQEKRDAALSAARKQGYYVDGDLPGVIINNMSLTVPKKHEGNVSTFIDLVFNVNNNTGKEIKGLKGDLELYHWDTKESVYLTNRAEAKRRYGSELKNGARGVIKGEVEIFYQDRLDKAMQDGADYAVIFTPSIITYGNYKWSKLSDADSSVIHEYAELLKSQAKLQDEIDVLLNDQKKYQLKADEALVRMEELKKAG